MLEEANIKGVTLKGFDITSQMIRQAKANEVLNSVEFKIADWCGKLPYEDNSIDKISAVISFGYTESDQAALVEALRVLKPGGVIALTVVVPDFSPTLLFLRGVWHSLWDNTFKDNLRIVPMGWRCLKVWKEVRRKMDEGIYNGYLPEKIKNLLADNGFLQTNAGPSSAGKIFTKATGTKPSRD